MKNSEIKEAKKILRKLASEPVFGGHGQNDPFAINLQILADALTCAQFDRFLGVLKKLYRQNA